MSIKTFGRIVEDALVAGWRPPAGPPTSWRTAFPETHGLFRYDTVSHASVPWGHTHDRAV